MKYPTWLEGHIKDWAEKQLTTMTLCSSAGNELLEVWYFGELLTIPGEPQPYQTRRKTPSFNYGDIRRYTLREHVFLFVV